MEKKLIRKINFLTAYAIISTCVFGIFVLSAFSDKRQYENFDEITVKRINVVSEAGDLRMVLSNESRQHPGRVNGQELPPRDRPAGIIFFNDEEDECGGIIYYGKTEDGETNSGMSFTMDQYKEDQVIQIINSEYYEGEQEIIRRGIAISDLPTGSDLLTRMETVTDIQNRMGSMSEAEREELIAKYGNSLSSKQRLFIGRTKNNNAGIYLAGPDGKQKIKIYVDEHNKAKIEVTDENGLTSNILQQD